MECDDEGFKKAYPVLAEGLFDAFATPYTGPFDLQSVSQDVEPSNPSYHEVLKIKPESRIEKKLLPTLRQRMDLPMIIRHSTIISRPDSGCEDNIMLEDIAVVLGLWIDYAPEVQKVFRIANGKIVKAVGRTTANCCFAKDRTVELRCFFYVFRHLVSPLIMGMAFLDETETLAKYRHRLEPRNISPTSPSQLCSLGFPRRKLYCLANSEPEFATADTGSEMNLMSAAFVRKRGFVVKEIDMLHSTIEFADGSLSNLQGKVEVEIGIGGESSARYWMEFYVLDSLTCDVLVGEDFLNFTAAFESYADAFSIDDDDDGVCEINQIVWFNMLELGLARLFHSGTVAPHQPPGRSQFRMLHSSSDDFERIRKYRTDQILFIYSRARLNAKN